jgi:hypothetical protein
VETGEHSVVEEDEHIGLIQEGNEWMACNGSGGAYVCHVGRVAHIEAGGCELIIPQGVESFSKKKKKQKSSHSHNFSGARESQPPS